MPRDYTVISRGYTWSRGEPLPELAPLAGLHAGATDQLALLAQVAGLREQEIECRWAAHNQAYVAWIGETPVAYGWSQEPQAVRRAGRAVAYTMAPGGRWLWDFVTLAEYRGLGVYPHLLQAILRLETAGDHFRISHREGNEASYRGIVKAGFRHTSDTVVFPDGEVQTIAAEGGGAGIRG